MNPPKIYIPTLNRVNTVFTTGNTVRSLALVKDRLVLVCVEEEEFDYIEALPPELEGVEILPCPVRGITHTREWIGKIASQRGETQVIVADDDLEFYTRKSPEAWNLRGSEDEDIEDMLHQIDVQLETHAAVGVFTREGFNHSGDTAERGSTAHNMRILRLTAFNIEDYNECKQGRVDFMEDFDILLQLLQKGRPNAVLTYYAQGQKQTQLPGGCSEYRDHQTHEKAAKGLAELHPEFVRLRQKQNKSGGEFGTRTEVTIQWKKAYQKGLETLL
jgi:hypothetical protein